MNINELGFFLNTKRDIMNNNNYQLGFLNGTLAAFAKFNNKDNCGYSFELKSFLKTDSILNSVKIEFKDVSESIELEEIHENHYEYLKNVFLKNLFDFQRGNPSLVDPNNCFSLFDKEFQNDLVVVDILDVFFEIINPKTIYELKMENLKKIYACSFLDIVIETDKENYFILHFSISN